EVSLDLAVPADAVNINYGFIMPGEGTAWFDDLGIELNGEKYTAASFNLGFETNSIIGLYTPPGGYTVALDTGTKHGGQKSLKISGKANEAGGEDAVKAAAASKAILEHMRSSREAYIAAGATPKDTDWAIHNADIIDQSTRLSGDGGFKVRDESMAANIAW